MSKNAPWSMQILYFCVLTSILGSVGCGSGHQDPPTSQQTMVIAVTPAATAITPGASLQFSASGDPAGVAWFVASATAGVGSSLGSISASGIYTAPSNGQSLTVIVTAISKTDPTKFASANVCVVAPGVVTPTNNVQVAQYTISPASSAQVSVQFGLDTNYGLTTWMQPTPAGGGPVSLYVAGMKAGTQYHMRGVVQFADGTQFLDADQTFTTGSLPPSSLPNLTATTTPGMTPQSGIELLDLLQIGTLTNQLYMVAVDLTGNVIWSYNPGVSPVVVNPIKLIPSGHFLLNFTGESGAPDGVDSVMQEVDLAGNLVWQMTPAQLNTALAQATCAECNVTIIGTHHDFAVLPNGHLIVIASTQQTLSDGTMPVGDVIIDLGDMENVSGNNPNHVPQPVWAWNEFNHLDTSRRPFSYPDWTHTNAILYSPDDGSLIISIRHQNWLLKIDYGNGAGAGGIIWHLGYQGDFTLLNADGSVDSDPTDWFYAQHGPSFVSKNTSGKFSLILFDNGDDRGVSVVPGGTCGVSGQPSCFSTVPLFQLDETAKTATMVFNPTAPDYSFFGGNAEVLKNGDVEYDICASTGLPAINAAIYEVTQTGTRTTVWQMNVSGQYAYRGMRIPSLYPGVQW